MKEEKLTKLEIILTPIAYILVARNRLQLKIRRMIYK